MTVQITTSGGLFRLGPKPVRDAVRRILSDIADAGEEKLDNLLRPRPGGVYLSVVEAARGQASTGHYRRNLSKTVSSRHALITDGGVVYGPWLEGTSSRNQTTRFKGYGAFRKTKQYLESKKKGIAEKALSAAVRKLNGA